LIRQEIAFEALVRGTAANHSGGPHGFQTENEKVTSHRWDWREEIPVTEIDAIGFARRARSNQGGDEKNQKITGCAGEIS
jgi:hypothetical protein